MFHVRKKVTYLEQHMDINDDDLYFQVNYPFKRHREPFPQKRKYIMIKQLL